MNKKRKFSLSLALIIVSLLVACGGNESIEKRLTTGGVWLAQPENRSSYLIVFTPEGNVLSDWDIQATFEITDSVLTTSSPKGDYVKEYVVSIAEDGNSIFLNNSFVDGSENTIVETTILTHHSEYKPTSLSSLDLENSFWGGSGDGYVDVQNAEEMAIFAFTSDEVAYFLAVEELKNLPITVRSIGDLTITEDAIFMTLEDDVMKFSVSVFNKDTIMLTSDETGSFALQRISPDVIEKAFPTAPAKSNDEIVNGLTPGIWITPAERNYAFAFLPDGTFIDNGTLELGTYEALTEDNSLYMNLTSEDDWGDWSDIFTITYSDNDVIILEGSLLDSGLQLEKYVSYEATAINDIDFADNWYLFVDLFITTEYQNQEYWAYLLSGDDVHVVGNSVILSNDDIRMNFTAYPFSEDIIYLHSPVSRYNFFMVRATN